MRKTIQKKVYDTATSKIVEHNTFGQWGDPAGYEEILYKTPTGNYFIYGIGGTDSKYPQETIIPAETPAGEVKEPAKKETAKKETAKKEAAAAPAEKAAPAKKKASAKKSAK